LGALSGKRHSAPFTFIRNGDWSGLLTEMD